MGVILPKQKIESYNPFAQIDTLMVYSMFFCTTKDVEQSLTVNTLVDNKVEIEILNWFSKLLLPQFQKAEKLKVFL